MSISSRASGFWGDAHPPRGSRMPSSSSAYQYVEDEDVEDEAEGPLLNEDPEMELEEEGMDDRTPLDRTIDKIGMGSYQWTLVSLCGFGWAADNMWIQAVAIILPRVQRQFSVPDSYIGVVSSSMFAGMMFGAVGWGACSDLMGRSTAFNATLFFTALFGLLASVANSMPALCVLLFLLGSSVGGSMPTDGTLLLEHMPQGKQYLVTALSVFFSIGAVIAAIVALLVVPYHSCSFDPEIECDVTKDNLGWKYLLIALGVITLSMFLARIVFFRLHESPRYLVSAGRHQEAIESLQMISRFNGKQLTLSIEDVEDNRPGPSPSQSRMNGVAGAGHEEAENLSDERFKLGDDNEDFEEPSSSTTVLFDTRGPSSPTQGESRTSRKNSLSRTRPDPLPLNGVPMDYNSTSRSQLEGDYNYWTPATESAPQPSALTDPHSFPPPSPEQLKTNDMEGSHPEGEDASIPPPSLNSSSPLRHSLSRKTPRSRHSRLASTSSIATVTAMNTRLSPLEKKFFSTLPRFIRKPLLGWYERVRVVLGPKWLRVTILVWLVWGLISMAYTMFNVFLPKLLESTAVSTEGALTVRSFHPLETLNQMRLRVREEDGPEDTVGSSLQESLWNVVIFTIGGCPGAILGAFMVETPLGRRLSLATSTFTTAIFCIIFIYVESIWAVRITSMGISLSATTMWAILYGWTPEIFGTEVRGTACGIASALSRIGGMIAPILGGILFSVGSRSTPVYTSVVVFFLGGLFVLGLKEGDGDSGRVLKGKKGARVIVH